jgi:hypothetical protein
MAVSLASGLAFEMRRRRKRLVAVITLMAYVASLQSVSATFWLYFGNIR